MEEPHKLEQKTKILIIDDDNNLVKTISNILKAHNFITYAADNGAKGIQKAFEKLPDLILCDITMGNINGYDVFNILKESSATSTIPFIFLTGKSEIKDLRYGMQLGADDYIVKPFEYDDLLTSIETRLNKHEQLIQYIEKKFLALIEISPNGVFVFQENKLIQCNKKITSILGYSNSELLKMSFQDLVSKNDRPKIFLKTKRCLLGQEKNIHTEFHAITKGGNEKLLEMYAIYGSRLKGIPSIIGIIIDREQNSNNSENTVNLNIKDIKEFENTINLISENKKYISSDLIKKLIKVFTNNKKSKIEHNSNKNNFSQREIEVLHHVCMGHSTKEIAKNLFISDRTVEKHRANLMNKTNSKNIIEVIIYGIKNNLIEI